MKYGPDERRDFLTDAERTAVRRAGRIDGLRAAIKIVQSNAKSKAATTQQIEAEIKRATTR